MMDDMMNQRIDIMGGGMMGSGLMFFVLLLVLLVWVIGLAAVGAAIFWGVRRLSGARPGNG